MEINRNMRWPQNEGFKLDKKPPLIMQGQKNANNLRLDKLAFTRHWNNMVINRIETSSKMKDTSC